MKASVFAKTLETMLANQRYSSLKDILSTMQPADIAAVFESLPEADLVMLFRLLPKDTAADTFSELDSNTLENLIRGLTDSELGAVVAELYTGDAADLVDEMPANLVKRVLGQADAEKRRVINEILRYPEYSAGSVMTTEYVSLRPGMTVEQAITHIRRTGVTKKTINNCYVIDQSRVLIGMLSIRMLILADSSAQVSDLMEEHVLSVSTMDDQESAVELMRRHGFSALPVVDGEGRLVGILTADDAMDILVDEATEDMEKMAAITPSDMPYLKTPVWKLWKARIPWLLLLMISATITGFIITNFEDALAAYVVLTAYIPMLMDTGGNSGSQASVTIIRALSLNELEFKDIFRVIWREARVSVLCGVTLAAVNFLKLLFLDKLLLPVAAAICLTLVFTVIAAKFIGCTLPMLAKKLGFDPAVCASPFITTIVDALSLLIYFQMARLFLGL